MRFAYAAIAALCAAVVSAQKNNAIVITGSTLDVTAGQPLTIAWTNPSSGTVTIKLQQDPVTPDSGAILANVPASDLTATLQIPPAGDVNSHLYTIEIIDDTDPTNINFSTNFGIAGATGTATGVVTGPATSTGSVTSTGSSTDTSLSTITTSASITSTDTASSLATDSSSSSGSSSSNDSSSSSGSSASTTSSQRFTSTSSSAPSTESTTAPDSGNGAGSLKVQGGLLAMAVGLIAVI